MSSLIDLKNIKGLDDKELSENLKKDISKSIKIVLQHRTVLVFINDIFSYKGKFEGLCLKTINGKLNVSLFKIKYPTNQIDEIFSYIKNLDIFDINNIAEWSKKASKRLNPNTETEKTLWSNAKEHCQICGRDLSMHYSTKQKGNLAQIAHIEATGINGPRNNTELENTNELENLMLLCYDCHRVVDFISPEQYTIELLKKIKNEQEKRVKSLLNTLTNPHSYPIKICNRLYGNDLLTPTDSDIIDALNNKNLSISSDSLKKHLLENSNWDKKEGHNPKYWEDFFQIYKKQIIFIKDQIEQSNAHYNSGGISLFLYHGISEMVMLGNQFGDTVNINVFQKHRDENKEFNWTWPNEKDKSGQINLEFIPNIEKNSSGELEGLLIVALSSDIDVNNLPNNLYNKDYVLPTIKIVSNQTIKKTTLIAKESDFEKAKITINQSLKKMKDEWRLNKIHLVIIAPQVINFHVGCAIQSKYQGEVVCYEKNTTSNLQEPTICIKDDLVYYYLNPRICLNLQS